jgi:catechol 2,3-dioxygenase-like lactoylglutathione lyase family enzyme
MVIPPRFKAEEILANRRKKLPERKDKTMLATTEASLKPTLHHVNFKTTRLQEMVEWYTAVLGVNVNFQAETEAFVSNDRANHRLAFLAFPGITEDPDKIVHTGLHHSAYEYQRFDDLMANYARLRDLGIEPEMSVNHGMTFSLYYADPDGNLVELLVDCFGDWDRSSEWMRTAPEFKANPIGAFYDPEDVLAAFRGGATFEQIRKDTAAGKYPPRKAPNPHIPH